MLELTPERLVEVISQRCSESAERLFVFWYHVVGDREKLCRRLKELRGDSTLVPLVVRRAGFDEPNAIMSDLRALIEDNRAEFVGENLKAPHGGQLVVLLLSRRQFNLPQISSPTVLPSWFPLVGGQNVYVTIDDLTRSATAPLDAGEARVEDICASLYNLEGVILARMRVVHDSINKNLCKAFISYLTNPEKPEAPAQFFESAQSTHDEVTDPARFRPSMKKAQLTARLLSFVQRRTYDQLTQPSKAVVEALGISNGLEDMPKESIAAVLLRPTQQDSPQARIGRNLLVTIYSAAQFITATHHADEYPHYPIILLQSVSYDLRVKLNDFAETIMRLEDRRG